MNVIKYNVNSGDVCQIGRQYEYGKTQVIFEGYQVNDSANEIYFKFVGRTDDSKYLIPIVDMTLDITQQLTKHVGQFRCQLEEMNTEGTLVSQSPVFYVAVKRSIKVGADYEVQDPRLETIYQKYNEMYNIISQTNETSLANESQRQAEWITLKQEVADAVASIDGKLDWYKASTTDTLQTRLNGFIGEAEKSIQTALETYETQTDSNINDKLTAYQSKTTSDINRMFDDSDRTSKEKIDKYISEIEQRRIAGEFNGSDGYTPVKGKDYFTESEIVQFKKDVTPKKRIDYFTDSEISQIQNEVSSGAIGDFKQTVDSETASFNTNAQEKLEAYNRNHTAKVAEYDANAAALQTEVDRLRGECDKLAAEKANIDGYYEEMTVGDAEQLVATQFVEGNEPYLFRSTGGSHDVGNRSYLDKIVGGTVAWNQLVEHGNFDAVSGWSGGTVSGNVLTITGTSDGTMNMTLSREMNIPSGHKTLAMCDVYCGSANNARIRFPFNSLSAVSVSANTWTSVAQIGISDTSMRVGVQMNGINGEIYKYRNFVLFDLTKMFGSTIADYIYSIEQSQAGAGVAWFKKLFPNDYYEYNAGELLSVGGLQSHDTVGFNQWDEEWEVGSIYQGEPIVADNCIRSKNFCPCIGGSTYYVTCGKTDGGSSNQYYVGIYWYDADKNYISLEYFNNLTSVAPSNARYFKIGTNTSTVVYGNVYHNDICINLSNPSRNGEYEPYKKHSYPLDSSLTLRGIPKLDASNNIYYDGDEYTSDGKVKRKYGVVEIGSLPLQDNGSITGGKQFGANISGKKVGTTNIFSNAFVVIAEGSHAIGTMIGRVSSTFVSFNSSITTLADFRTAMQGVYLVYELATPTTETAEPFQHIQIVDDFGTEEFVSNGFIPVGHNTRYPANLRDKLQHLPSLASADGTYLIQQSGKQMSLVHMPAVFPDTPTEDGTYTLKTVVTGGVATLQWVAE